MVGAAVPEGQLECLEPDGTAQQLVAQADAPHGHLAHHAAHRVHDVVERRGVAGAVGQEHGVGIAREDLLGRDVAGVQLEPHAPVAQVAHDRALDAGVDADHERAVAALEDLCLGGAHLAREVAPGHRGLGLDALASRALRHVGAEHPAAHRALVADVAHQGARVHARERRHAAVGEPREPAALGAGTVLAVHTLAHDHRTRVDAVGLHVRGRDAVVADQRVGEDDHLTGVARVGDRLLVARHGGVEHDLPRRDFVRAHGLAVEAGAVLEEEVHQVTAPSANERSR